MNNLKLPAFLNTPLGLVLAILLTVFVAEFGIMWMLPGHGGNGGCTCSMPAP